MVRVLLSMTGKALEPPLRLPAPVHVTDPLISEEAVASEGPGRLSCPERIRAPLSVAVPDTIRLLEIESAEGSSKLRLLHWLGWLIV
jgi:hypothetical protein